MRTAAQRLALLGQVELPSRSALLVAWAQDFDDRHDASRFSHGDDLDVRLAHRHGVEREDRAVHRSARPAPPPGRVGGAEALEDGDVGIDLTVRLDDVDPLVHAGDLVGRQVAVEVGEGPGDHELMQTGPEGRMLKIRVHPWERARHGFTSRRS